MAKIKVHTPDGKTLVLNAPDGAAPEQIQSMAKAAMNDYQSKQSNASNQPPQGLGSTIMNAAMPPAAQLAQSAMQAPQGVQEGLVRAGAPVVGEAMGGPIGAGVASAAANTAIDVAKSPQAQQVAGNMALSEATGNPGKAVVQGMQGVAQNPQGVMDSLKNSAAQGAVAAAGTGIASGIKNAMEGASGPFSSVFNNPSLAKGSVRQALKQATGNGEYLIQQTDRASGAVTTGELNRLREMAAAGGQKLVKAANEAANVSENNQLSQVPASKLLMYEDILGKASTKVESGSATGYQKAVSAIRQELANRGPQLDDIMGKKAGAATAYAAEGKGPGGSGPNNLIQAVNALPGNAVSSLLSSTVGNPLLLRGLGAASRGLTGAAPAMAGGMSPQIIEALKRLSAARGQ